MTLNRPLWDDTDLEALNIATRGTLQNWRQRGIGPPFVLLNGSIKYIPSEVEKWLADRPQHLSTSEYLSPRVSRGNRRNTQKTESEDEKAQA